MKKIEEKITIPDTHLKMKLQRKGFFHNCNKGVNGLLGYKAQICLYPKEKIGILTVQYCQRRYAATLVFSFRANVQ